MTGTWKVKLGAGIAATALLGTSIVVASAPASADGTPQGCTGVTPRKPWRLVATRPDPNASAVDIQWSPVGCTTGYRVVIVGTGVDRRLDIAGGMSSSVTVPDLAPSASYHITVTSVGIGGDGGTSGDFRLHRSGASARAELSIDFPDAGPADPVAATAAGTGPWVNPELRWTAPTGSTPDSYRLTVTGSGGAVVAQRTVPGSSTQARLGDAVAAGVPYTVTVTPLQADGTEGRPSRLAFGTKQAPRPEQVTGIAPVVQFTPVTSVEQGRVLGYEIAFGPLKAAKHVFVAAPPATTATPWVAVDPSFAAVETSDTALPMERMVTVVRTITTMGKSGWTAAETIGHTDVATAESAYFAGIGHVDGGTETVPRNGFLNVHGTTADLQVTDLVWSRSPREQDVPVTLVVLGASGSTVLTQEVPLTHLRAGAQDAWRASDIPLPDGWTSVVLRRGGVDVARWANSGGRPCVAAVSYADAPTDLPQMWKDSWCGA